MDYQYKTTFWTDFDLAEVFGEESIRSTAERAFEEWKDDIVYLTELVMVLNHKCWDYYYRGDDELSKLYEELYYDYDEKAMDYLQLCNRNDDITYYIRTLD